MSRQRAEELIAEGKAVPVAGWDFSWFVGRATEQRPSWGYAVALSARLAGAPAALDLQTGGGEVLAFALGRAARRPARVVATEAYPPNRALARERLAPFDVAVHDAPEDGPLPIEDGALDLVSSRHPVRTPWAEIGRVLRPGGRYFSQQVGAGSNRELAEYFLGPTPENPDRRPETAVAAAQRAGLAVVDLRVERLALHFFDVAAVVYFLRKVIWTVPGLDADAHHERLVALHEQIARDGAFVSHAVRFLFEAERRP